MTIYLGDTCEQISVYSECDGYLYHPNVFGLYNNTKVDANGYSVFEQVDGISNLNFTCSYDPTIHKWVIGETNNTKIVSGPTESLCPSFNDTTFAWFYEDNVHKQ